MGLRLLRPAALGGGPSASEMRWLLSVLAPFAAPAPCGSLGAPVMALLDWLVPPAAQVARDGGRGLPTVLGHLNAWENSTTLNTAFWTEIPETALSGWSRQAVRRLLARAG